MAYNKWKYRKPTAYDKGFKAGMRYANKKKYSKRRFSRRY